MFEGVLKESFTQQIVDPKWLAILDKRAFDTWEKKHKVSVNTSINEALVAYVGKPLDKLLTYLAFNHSQHCAPSILSSGLASLPLSYIYKYGKNTKIRTTGKLPTGESLNGKRAYEMMLPYFTTVEMTPDEVYSLGERMLGQLYPKAVEIAKKITNKTREDQAIEELKKHLEDRSMYFNDEKIPQNESNKDAFDKCTSMAKAKIYCPKRYQAMKAWFEYVNCKYFISNRKRDINHISMHSVTLFEELQERSTLACGTITSNRSGLPKKICGLKEKKVK